MKKIIAVLLMLMLGGGWGCAKVISVTYQKGPYTCQTDEVRPSMLSTTTNTGCWDKENNMVGFYGHAGTSGADVATGAVQGAGVAGGAIGFGIQAGRAFNKGTKVQVELPHP